MGKYGQMRKDYVVLPGDQPRPVDPAELPSAKRIRHISDAELFKALRLDMPELSAVAEAVKARRYDEAYRAWEVYFASRPALPLHPSEEVAIASAKENPQERQTVVQLADQLVRHEVPAVGGTVSKLGKRIKFKKAGPGAEYMGWLYPLEVAYVITGDERYAGCFDDIFNQWYDVRDKMSLPGKDDFNPVWNELAVCRRLRRWQSSYWLFRHSSALRPATRVRLLKAILGTARWLYEHNAANGYRGGNWQLGACFDLLSGARVFPEFREAPAWRRVALKWLLEHAERDFFADGGFSERITGYGAGCVITMQWLHDRAVYLGLPAPTRRWLHDRIHAMYRWYLLTATPPHGALSYGDGGGGDATPMLVGGFKLTGDRELLWPIRDSEFAKQHKPKEPAFKSTCACSSGFAIMRENWEKDALYMSINFGPYGSPHTHYDLLNFEIFAYGTRLAADTNRYGSYACPIENIVRASTAHNQIVVNNLNFDRLNSRGENVIWSTQEGADFFHASHRGYEKSHNVHLERSIIFVRGEYWFMSDVVREFYEHHSYTWYLHSPWRWKVGCEAVVQTRHKPGLLAVPAMADEIRHVSRGCTYDARDTAGFVPPPQNERHWIGYQKYTHDDTVVTYGAVLLPYKSKPPQNVQVKALNVLHNGKPVHRGEAEAFEVLHATCRDVFIFAHRGSRLRTYGDINTDARMALLRFKGKRLRTVSAVDVSLVAVKERRLLAGRKQHAEFSRKLS